MKHFNLSDLDCEIVAYFEDGSQVAIDLTQAQAFLIQYTLGLTIEDAGEDTYSVGMFAEEDLFKHVFPQLGLTVTKVPPEQED